MRREAENADEGAPPTCGPGLAIGLSLARERVRAGNVGAVWPRDYFDTTGGFTSAPVRQSFSFHASTSNETDERFSSTPIVKR